jgi:hypothetical protein
MPPARILISFGYGEDSVTLHNYWADQRDAVRVDDLVHAAFGPGTRLHGSGTVSSAAYEIAALRMRPLPVSAT